MSVMARNIDVLGILTNLRFKGFEDWAVLEAAGTENNWNDIDKNILTRKTSNYPLL